MRVFHFGRGGPATIANSVAATSVVGGGNSQAWGPLASVTAGNTLLVMGSCQNAALSTVTDTLGTVYTQVTTTSFGSGTNMIVWIGTASISGADTITTVGSGGCAFMTFAYYEISNTGGVDVFNSGASTGTPSITTTVASDVIMSFGVSRSGQGTFVVTTPTVLDNGGGGSSNSANAHTPTSTAGSYLPQFQNSTSGANAWINVAMKPASPPIAVWAVV